MRALLVTSTGQKIVQGLPGTSLRKPARGDRKKVPGQRDIISKGF